MFDLLNFHFDLTITYAKFLSLHFVNFFIVLHHIYRKQIVKIDIKTLCTLQSTFEKMNIQVTDLQRMFENHLFVKELVARIFFLNLITQK